MPQCRNWPLLLVVALIFTLGASRGAGGQAIAPRVIDPVSFRGLGTLAFVSDATLYVLDGRHGNLQRVAHSGPVWRLKWSPDGRWLAYKQYVGSPGAEPPTTFTDVWVVRADGADAHRALAWPVESFAWAPVGPPRLALSVVRQGRVNGLWLTTPDGPPYKLVSVDETRAFAWSPDGQFLAYAALVPSLPDRGDAMYTIPRGGGRPVRQFVEEHGDVVMGDWWPDGKGILFWSDPIHSTSIASHGLPLRSLRLADRHVDTLISSSPLDPSSLTWSPDGHSLIVVKSHSSRVGYDHALELCDARTATCRPVPQQAGTVALAPAWSRDGQSIAFISAPEARSFATAQDVEAWKRTTRLVVKPIVGTGRRGLVIPAPQLSRPLWSRDGRHILYVSDDGVWMLDIDTRTVHQVIAGPINSIAWHQ